jgi:hypothetical protein
MASKLYEKENYLTSEKYVSGRITEYDIKSCNINMLLKAGIIDEDYYNLLSNLPKQDREVEVGLLHIRMRQNQDIDLSKIISEKCREYRQKLFEANDLQDNEIVRIAKDAVFVLRSYDLAHTEFDGIIFRPKMVASAMMNVNKIQVYCWYNNQDQIEIEVKGLGQNSIFHQNGMLSFIANTMYMIDRVSVKDALLYTQSIYKDYVKLKLPLDYYGEFNSDASFLIKYSNYATQFYNGPIEELNIDFNLNVIREVYGIVFNIYNQSHIVTL